VSGRSGVAGRVVVAVDPHKRSWTAAAVDGSLRLQTSIRVEANREGYRELRRLSAYDLTCSAAYGLTCRGPGVS
jgi:transposase